MPTTKARKTESLSNFKRKSSDILKRLRASGDPVLLTVHGKPELIVQDAASYHRLLQALDEAETVAGIRRGQADHAAGRTRSLRKLVSEKRREHGLSR